MSCSSGYFQWSHFPKNVLNISSHFSLGIDLTFSPLPRTYFVVKNIFRIDARLRMGEISAETCYNATESTCDNLELSYTMKHIPLHSNWVFSGIINCLTRLRHVWKAFVAIFIAKETTKLKIYKTTRSTFLLWVTEQSLSRKKYL